MLSYILRRLGSTVIVLVLVGLFVITIFLEFLLRLIKRAERKLFVIVDNLRVHRAKRVMAWLAENADRIGLFFLPPYAP